MNISSSTPSVSAQYDVAVAQKQQASTREQGQQAVQLIEAAGSPGGGAKPTPHGHAGHHLNVVA